jgi:hypothetical protein
MIRTTMYINKLLLKRLIAAADTIDVTKDQMISLLLSRIIRNNSFEPQIFDAQERHFKPVEYQKSLSCTVWKTEHIKFEPVFYKKALDLRRNFKFSVSWFIAYAIRNYLDELVEEMLNPKDPENIADNYNQNSVYIARLLGDVQVFISMLGFPEEKYLERFIF